MKIGLAADSHDNLPSINRMLDAFAKMDIDAMIHAGDFVAPFAVKKLLTGKWSFHGVFGNNDGEKEGILKIAPQIKQGSMLIELGGKKIGVVHDRNRWDGSECDLLVFGHTHMCFYKETNGRLEINPGEVGGWLNGKSTVAVFNTETSDAEIIEV